MHARRLASAAGTVAALLSLSACQKPTPIVSLYGSGTALHDSAFSYCFDGQDPSKQPGSPGACRYEADRTPEVLRVRPGDVVTVDVDKDLSDAGWFVALGTGTSPPRALAAQSGHVTTFQPDFSAGPTVTVQVRKLESTKPGAKPLGVWQFVVVPR